ncbi:transposase [Streptomyces sp. NPDC059534]|uniref:transposase n=1 Tax=Streptomyces sp. NPDC059534 TaxID=3346859 RepID=UPI0036A9F829
MPAPSARTGKRVFGPAPSARTGPKSTRCAARLPVARPGSKHAKGEHSVNPICCPQCGGLSAYCIRHDGLFQCPECRHLLDRRDIDLDGTEVWGVTDDGTLYTTTDPARSLNCLMEAVEDLLTADNTGADYARLDSMRNATESLAAYIDARRLGIKRPEFGYTEETVKTAVNAGADMVLDAIGFTSAEEDAINLVVNAAITSLTNPGVSFAEMVEENFGEDAEEVRTWWGWSK